MLVGELLCRAVDVRAGERVLDVAAGSGNAALAAARRGARVIATGFAGTPTMTLKGIAASAPSRLTRSAAGRLRQPASRVNYLVP